MAVKFNETKIPEMVASEMMKYNGILGTSHVSKVVEVMVMGVSKLLGEFKDMSTPVGVVFKKTDGSFVAGAKVQFIPAQDGSTTGGNWSYIWSYNEDDIKDAKIIEIDAKSFYVFNSVSKKYHFRFPEMSLGIMLFTSILSNILAWLKDNYKENEIQAVELPGVLYSSVEVVDGELVYFIEPKGEAKVIIKDDDTYQETVAV